jgi:hypothetical protein
MLPGAGAATTISVMAFPEGPRPIIPDRRNITPSAGEHSPDGRASYRGFLWGRRFYCRCCLRIFRSRMMFENEEVLPIFDSYSIPVEVVYAKTLEIQSESLD